MSPSQILDRNRNDENMIRKSTDALINLLGLCEKIVIAAYTVANYVPIFKNDEQREFWEQKVIPNLVESLTQDVRFRSIMFQSLASIGALSITIQKAGGIIKQFKGSSKAIEIAQKRIPEALDKLEEWIKVVSTLDNSAIKTFSSQTKKIFEILGPEAINFVDRRVEIESQLESIYGDQKKLYAELAEKQGEVTRYSFLISATEKHLNGATQELEETKHRTDALNQLNTEVEQTIQKIQVSTPQTITTKQRHGIWFWRNYSSTTTKTVMVENHNREAEKKYCESIILSRMTRIRENQNDEAAKKKVMQYLDECLSEHKSKYDRAMKELKNINETFEGNMKRLQDKIDNLHKEIEKIDEKEIVAENKVGLQGKALLQCLVQVRMFAKTIKDGTSVYAPLISILENIKHRVQSHVDLLSSDKQSEIFSAGNELLNEVEFLSSYSVTAPQVLQASIEYNSLANPKIENKGGT